ncbi:MAG TPA: glycosyltransferase family A protein [Terriglobales bacterium]
MENKLKARPTVAVIIPYYNGAKWVERAIKSVVSQTIKPDEFVIVNDGSKPEERTALTPLSEKYEFRIIDKANGGQGSARNAGVAETKSDYLCFLDQDDFYLPTHIEDLVEALPERDLRLGFVYADLCEADEAGDIINTNLLKMQTGAGLHPKRGHIVGIVRNDLFILPSASIIYRPAFEKVGGFDPQFMGYEDDDLFLRMFRAGYTNYFLDKSVTVWCTHSGSTSWSIKMSRSRFRYFKKLASSFPDDPFRKISYMRDCFVPRFGSNFIDEAIKAHEESNKDALEYLAILEEYVDIISAYETVDDEAKRKARRAIRKITGEPLQTSDYGKYQESLRLTYQSTCWRISKPMRLLSRGWDNSIPFSEESAAELFEKVRASLSWKLTLPIRLLKPPVTK